jgi:SAM-dependent methyltransferase
MSTQIQSLPSTRTDLQPRHRSTPGRAPGRAPSTAFPGPSHWPAIIAQVRNHWGLFAVVALVVGAAIIAVAAQQSASLTGMVYAGSGVLALIVVAVTALLILDRRRSGDGGMPLDDEQKRVCQAEDRKRKLLDENREVVKDADAPPLTADGLTQELQQLRLVLHQAARYSTPTYYLDSRLNIIDWNVAFELIFSRILHKLRGRHVNHFIAELENCDAVFDHARDFTVKVEQGELPLIDMEPLVYQSDIYGTVRLEKVASQLTDPDAQLKAWAVALMIREIDWDRFHSDLLPRLHEHKLWSIYAVSYDAILLKFPPYSQLIQEVIGGVPREARHVMDLGAGTGNVSRALLQRGHRVTAVENNQAMLEKLFSKKLDPAGSRLILKKNSAATLGSFPDNSFDAIVAVNVLYALDDPLGCIRNVARILKPGGVFTLSTTTAETELDLLLTAIKDQLQKDDLYEANREHYQRVYELNKDIEIKLAKRHPRQAYEDWIQGSGFQICYRNPNAYVNAVTVFHARKSPAKPILDGKGPA